MDRSLDDVISDRQRSNYRSRDRRPPRDGIRKSTPRDEPRSIDHDWVHDRYDDDDSRAAPRRRGGGNGSGGGGGGFGGRQNGRRSPELDLTEPGAKIRVDNLHYDLTEEDLRELFSRIGTVGRVQLLYDRQDRSRGIGYITMPELRDARVAVREYDGANANGQPIRLTLLPTPSSASSLAKPRNPFDTAERPGRSLFDRIEKPTGRSRSESPDRRARRSDVSKPAPEHIDRYIPGERNDHRRRSPLPPRRGDGRRGGGGSGPRRPGERRRRSPAKDADGHPIVQGRPRKTQEELDAEMADYWGKDEAKENGSAETGVAHENPGQAATTAADDDIDMIE